MGKKATTIVIQIRHPPKLPEQMSAGTELPGCCFPVPPASRSVGRNSILGLLEVLCPAVMEAPWSQGTLPEEGCCGRRRDLQGRAQPPSPTAPQETRSPI